MNTRNLNFAATNTNGLKKIGIDQNFFSRSKGFSAFDTIVTDQSHKRLRAVTKTQMDAFEG